MIFPGFSNTVKLSKYYKVLLFSLNYRCFHLQSSKWTDERKDGREGGKEGGWEGGIEFLAFRYI